MSFVTTIRDYAETLNSISDSLGQNFTVRSFILETIVYIFTTCRSCLFYILSFQWIHDFTLLPIVLPEFSSALFREKFFLETPSKVFFDFLEISDLQQNKFLLGFFNSFFLSLPFSVIHILSLRRLLIQGRPAGVYTIGGYLIGQLVFLTCVVFGIRQVLVPWLTLEPFNYLLGIILLFRVIYSMTRENLIELKGWSNPRYTNFFLVSFVLAWCEQTSCFQYLGNITLSSNVTILESFSSTSSISTFFTHTSYLLGIAIGSVLFSLFWGWVFLQVKNLCIFYTPLFTSSFLQFFNKTSFVLALALSLTSIPFYGFEYLVTGPLGFVSQDSVFKNTLLDQTLIKDPGKGLTGLSSLERNFQYLDVDVSPFDRGDYLTVPEVPQNLSFEELNYRGEFDWTLRNLKVSGITDSRSGFFTLSKLFKKENKKSLDSQKQLSSQEISERNPLLSELPLVFRVDLATHYDILNRYRQFYDGNVEERDSDPLLQRPIEKISDLSFPSSGEAPQPRVENTIESKIKNKYYSNPVYKNLLALDIDLFLKRQPKTFQVNADQEIDLYTKRKMLEYYTNSLNSYSQLPYFETFDSFFDGAKTFSNKVYNQQFKGTLRSVRRLFTVRNDFVSSSEKLESKTEKVLKFDQPLYQFAEKQPFSPYHEELAQKPEQVLPRTQIGGISFVNTPLYAGWDEHLRKFVITNKLLPRTFAGYKVKIEPQTLKNFTNYSVKQTTKIKFTRWPLSEEKLQLSKQDSSVPYVTLFKILDEKTKKTFAENKYLSFPANFELVEFSESQNEKGTTEKLKKPTLVPNRGGFVWPGNSKFKLPLLSN